MAPGTAGFTESNSHPEELALPGNTIGSSKYMREESYKKHFDEYLRKENLSKPTAYEDPLIIEEVRSSDVSNDQEEPKAE